MQRAVELLEPGPSHGRAGAGGVNIRTGTWRSYGLMTWVCLSFLVGSTGVEGGDGLLSITWPGPWSGSTSPSLQVQGSTSSDSILLFLCGGVLVHQNLFPNIEVTCWKKLPGKRRSNKRTQQCTTDPRSKDCEANRSEPVHLGTVRRWCAGAAPWRHPYLVGDAAACFWLNSWACTWRRYLRVTKLWRGPGLGAQRVKHP